MTFEFTAFVHLRMQWTSEPAAYTCVDDKSLAANRLQLNAAKTEILCCSSQRQIAQYHVSHFLFAALLSFRHPSFVTWECAWIDNGLTMSVHVSTVVAGCFAMLRRRRSVPQSLSQQSFTRLLVAVVLPRLDYCNRVVAGLPTNRPEPTA